MKGGFKMSICLKHKWFWENIEIKFDKTRVWNTLNLKVCVKCGKIKAEVRGKDDYSIFRAFEKGKQRLK